MALQPEDDGAFVWPPPHWPFPAIAPMDESLALSDPGMPAPPMPPPQQVGPVGMPAPVDEVAASSYLPPLPGPPPPIEVPPPVDAVSGDSPIVPQMPVVDAVSGADPATPPPPSDEPPADDQIAPVGDQTYIDPLSPQSWNKPISSADLYTMAKRDPVGYAQHIQAMDAAANQEMQRREKVLATQNASREEQNYQDMFDAQERANALHKEIMNTRINPNRVRENRGPLQSIAAMLSVVIGGLYQARKGGPNIGLQILDQETDRDIAAQEADLSNKRNALADLRATGMSQFQAKQAYRAAVYTHAREELMTKMQDFDPAGTTARNLAQQALEIESRIGQAAELGRRSKLEEELKRRKDDRETLTTLSELRKRDAETAKMSRVGMGGPPALDKQVLSPQELASTFGGPVPPVPMSIKDYRNTYLSTVKSAAETKEKLGQEAPEAKRERELGINGPDGKPLLDEANTPVRGRDIAEATKLTDQIADTDEVIRMMDEVLRLRAKHGWSSDLVKSPEWRKMQSNWASIILKKKNIDELGVIAGPDMELMGKALGAEDPTSLRDPTAGIEQGRQNAVQGLHGRLTIKGVGAKSLPQYPETWKKQKPTPTAIDETIGTLIDPGDVMDDRIDMSKGGFAANMAAQTYDLKAPALALRAKIQYLEDAARGDGPQAAKARQGLVEIAAKSTQPWVKDAAAQALRNLAASSSATTEGTK